MISENDLETSNHSFLWTLSNVNPTLNWGQILGQNMPFLVKASKDGSLGLMDFFIFCTPEGVRFEKYQKCNLKNMSKEKFWKIVLGLSSGLLLQQRPDLDQKQTLQKNILPASSPILGCL